MIVTGVLPSRQESSLPRKVMVGLLSNPPTFLNSGSFDFNPLVYFRVSSKCVGRRILQMNEVRAELLFALFFFVVFLSSSSRSWTRY
ncbi:uncharacterized protein K444DRAFT_443154 [Hyaloscypha bicolor E]|uniref:Uncharacterized protein n=1 Tax=Hyaloscypha bicolor E TaxID=1095630 RepID=A0A2J6T5N2_9HELO|nr:uncharacterized protein K444DRAFT_443154 [Hyaloscypha bicolor E]PMD58319.1 hypothetical protein K444DRAFT_443154 [Hyaloscypha bicolor E]